MGEFERRAVFVHPDEVREEKLDENYNTFVSLKIVDEAYKEFPNEDAFGKTSELACIDALNKIIKWKKKWFGE